MTPEAFIAVAVCGLFIGVLSGMFGIGGGTLIVPLLNLAFGLPALTSAATSLFTIAPTAVSGATQHLRQKTIDVKAGVIIGCTGAASSALSASFSDQVPALVIILLTAAVIIYSAFRMFASAHSQEKQKDRPSAREKQKDRPSARLARPSARSARLAPAPHSGTAKIAPSHRTVFCACLGVFAGLVAGIVGVGGGFIIVPIGIAYLGFSMKQAAGTSLVSIALIAVPGIAVHALLGHVAWLYGLALIIGTIPGANVGAWLIMRLPERALRMAFGILLVFAGILLVARQLV
jgi:uncharacterized membrane protein YfcA